MQSLDELQENLATYRSQLEQVSQLLEQDPSNEEYNEMATGLREVVEMTEDLLRTALQVEGEQGSGPANYSMDAQEHLDETEAGDEALARFEHQWTAPRSVTDPDNESYPAGSDFPSGYGTGGRADEAGEEEREVEGEEDLSGLSALERAEREAFADRDRLKRKIEESSRGNAESKAIPSRLQIRPEDPEHVRATKSKKIKAIKSKMRQERKDLEQNRSQNKWMQFQNKGKKRQVGFLTGLKKESIFKSPEDTVGKVGVVGSGQKMTDFRRRDKNLNLKNSLELEEEEVED